MSNHALITGNWPSISLQYPMASNCLVTAAYGGRDNFNSRHVRPRCQRPVCYRALPVMYCMVSYRRLL